MTNKQKSIIYMIIATFGFSLMGVFVKLTGDISVSQKTIFRTGTIIIVSIIMMNTNNVKLSSIKHHKILLLRSLFGTIGILLNYYAIDHLVLSDADVIFRLNTIFLLIFCWIFLKEKLTLKQFITIIVAFIGVVFVIKPAFSIQVVPYMLAVLGAAFAALAYTAVRALGQREHPVAIVFYFSVFTTLILLPYVIINFEPMSLNQLIYAVLAGLCAAVGQVGLTVAYKHAPAKEISIYSYLGVLFSAFFSVVIFGVLPDWLSIIGYFIIFGASYYMYRQNKSVN